MAFVTKHGVEVDNPRAGRPTLDENGVRRIQDMLMLAMEGRGWSLRQIAGALGFSKNTVAYRLGTIPQNAQEYCREVAKSHLGAIPGPMDFAAAIKALGAKGRRGRGPSRPKVDLALKKPLAVRHREAREKLDALCLDALAKHGTVWEAARSLKITTRRVKAAIERRRVSEWHS